ncbi:uncharacterized protein LOC124594697 [Schistocerca americana]|uniref:uncharacterized protein LOC124594697 n=1 Tax=Schistocerca americana TaxID=7009 RepID=UPI001F4F2DA5|nr:uncharacterized protein LOC124594697 [Schistocerca americana]
MATSALPQKRRSEQADVELEWTDRQSAFRKRICTGEIYNHNIQDPRLFLERCFPLFKTNVETKHQALKINCSLLCIFLSPISAEEKEIYISSKNKEFFISDDIYAWYTEHVVEAIMKKFDSFQERDSGLALKEIVKLCVNLNVNKGFRVGGNHELPDVIRDKRAVVSIHSSDNECFKWAVLCALYPVKQNKYKLSNYKKFENELNFTGIPFPMEFKYLTQFERQNPGISVNVYGIQYDNGDWMVARKNITQNKEFNFVPIHISKQRYNRHANLLVLQTDFSNIYHFYCITNLSRLMRSSLTSHKQSIHFCERCLCYFYTEDKLKVHLEDCIKFQAVRTVMPSKETKTIQFQNYCNKEKVPFVIYGDIECMLQPLSLKEKEIKRKIQLEEELKPVSDPLRELVSISKREKLSYPTFTASHYKEGVKPENLISPDVISYDQEEKVEDDEKPDILTSPDETLVSSILRQIPPKERDEVYGMRYDLRNGWMIGNEKAHNQYGLSIAVNKYVNSPSMIGPRISQ